MKFDIPRKPFEIVKNNDIVLTWLRIEIGQHATHTRTLQKITAARGIVWKNHLDIITFGFSVLATTMFLAVQA
nr:MULTISPECIES: hypothetical protein [Actibacterium]